MNDFGKIAEKWQKKWEEEKVFHAEADERKKYYVAIVYPYMSGLLHLGHLFTYTFSEIVMRYKRMQGYNVLAKYGFHCTGTPIIAAAQRVREKEKSQIETLKKMGISDKEIHKFAEPEYWCEYFPKETLKDSKAMGFAIDERYAFRTTHLNPPYDRFITWQFNKLKEKDLVKKGKHPVIWCPKDNVPVGDHDRAEGEGETPKDFIWVKFRMKDSELILLAGTTRPDALLGQTHLWVNPEATYTIVKVKNEKWAVGKEAVKKIQKQYSKSAEIIGTIKSEELIGKWAQGPLVNYPLYIVPAWFIDENVGSGVVYSALEDPVDLVEIQHIQSHPEIVKKYKLDPKVVEKLKPISIINVPEMSDNLGQDMINKYQIKSPSEKEKIEQAKDELNRVVFRKGVMKKNCGKYAGLTVPDAQAVIKKDLTKEDKEAVMFYEMTGKVVCRCLTECIVKMVEDQWFIEYNDPEWKKKAHECLDSMAIYPEIVRKQFDYVLDWLDHWACTREYGLGTKLPWDLKWVIESLSDSTIQMAYGTISKYLQNPKDYGFKADKLNDEFFDYVFLGKGTSAAVEKSTGIPKKMIDTMKRDFEYWYPFDFRNSAKDLVQNHLSFSIFNHAAIFPKKHWPKAFAINGRIMVNNEKMSKSKGNFFTMRELYEKHGADIVRLTAANAGEGVDDANYDMEFLQTAKKKLNELHEFILKNHNKGRTTRLTIDGWLESRINDSIKNATESMESMMFKSALQYGFMDMQRNLKWYMKRTNNNPNKETINLFIESAIKMLTPFTPHFAEECWSIIGKKPFVSNEKWPKANLAAIDAGLDYSEELIRNTLSDIREVLKLANIEKPKMVTLILPPSWKYDLFKNTKLFEEKDFGKLLKEAMADSKFKAHGQEIQKFLPAMVKNRKVPKAVLSKEQELSVIKESLDFIKNEFGCDVELIEAEKSGEQKAKQAVPGKPAIIIR
ncbi:leucine--tRNA ligase [Candidatus Woesearchaeota archaeon]|nr:leucine--tRNA ligase [Candidatus Woesearchaeota archaeon]